MPRDLKSLPFPRRRGDPRMSYPRSISGLKKGALKTSVGPKSKGAPRTRIGLT